VLSFDGKAQITGRADYYMCGDAAGAAKKVNMWRAIMADVECESVDEEVLVQEP
jgi:predicted chitinase